MAERVELQAVSCSNCSNFQPDDSVQGLGKCAVVEAETIPMEKHKRYIECGSNLCWTSDKPNRLCQHYVPVFIEEFTFNRGNDDNHGK